MEKEFNNILAIIIVLLAFAFIGECLFFHPEIVLIPSFSFQKITLPTIPGIPSTKVKDIKKFISEEDFKDYLEKSEISYGAGYRMVGTRAGGPMMEALEAPTPTAPPSAIEDLGKGVYEMAPERVSETTVQVLGIDEPDIVKTDGKEIYFSNTNFYWREPEPFLEERIIPPKKWGATNVITAFPPADLEIIASIDKTGDLLLAENILIIFSYNKIYGYDISNPKTPEEKWTIDLKDNNYLTGVRLYQGKLYLITMATIDRYHPCPIEPILIKGVPITVRCVDIYHPVPNIPIDVNYNAFVINPASGEKEKNISFVGTSGSSVLYMSEQAMYITYSYYGDTVEFIYNFFQEKAKDIVPDQVIKDLARLKDYELSSQAKLTELAIILQRYTNSLDNDERLRIENELANRMQDYLKVHKRDLEKTGIAKISLDSFEVLASGAVPGTTLNQFSLDEYNGYLRIATTIGGGFVGIGTIGESANDVYVLDKNLKVTGLVQDLGLEERIYSVRFLEDKAYIVTFRQIDPFFVLDLSDPKNPELKGQLKIPGYSSYLHPISKDKILGIGKEESYVKISLFDVASPENPFETSKYTLKEYWSDILNTHHAFLLDKKHKIFFLPGSQGGYIFSYQENQLKLVRAVSGIRARRAIYINDYLYIIGDDRLTVLNEINWEKVNEIEF